MPSKTSLKFPANNEPGGVDGRKSLKIRDDGTTPAGQRSPSITSKASSGRAKKSIKPGSTGGKSLTKFPKGPEAEVPQWVAEASTIKKTKTPRGTGGSKSGSISSSSVGKGSRKSLSGVIRPRQSNSSIGKGSRKSLSVSKGSRKSVTPSKTSRKSEKISTRLKSNPDLKKKKSQQRAPRAGQPAINRSFKQRFKNFLYLGPTRVSDVEIQEGEEVPPCSSKTSIICLIVLILLILILVIIFIFASPKRGAAGSNNDTTTPTSAATTTTSTGPTGIPGCNLTLPEISDPFAVGGYCKRCVSGDRQQCVDDCCAKYYARFTKDFDDCWFIC